MILTALCVSACKGGEESKTAATANLRATAVIDCNITENRDRPECTQKCIEDPTLAWCRLETAAKFTCPTDGSYKAVNPFSGEGAGFPPNISYIPDLGGDITLDAKPFKDGEFQTTITGKGSSLYIGSAENKIDLGSTITSIGTIKVAERYYAIVGTAGDLKVVPFVHNEDGTIEIKGDEIKAFSNVGGIPRVIAAPSIDISGATNATGLPPGMWSSINAPPEGGTTGASAASGVDFVYMVSVDGNVWRMKFNHLLNGGCAELLYLASKNPDDKGRNMPAKKIAVAGQYLTVLAATDNKDLPAIDDAQLFWERFENELLNVEIPKSHKLIIKDFYWFANHLIKPLESRQSIKVLDLLTSTSGDFKEINLETGTNKRFFITDILLKGNVIYMAAYAYDTTPLAGLDNLTISENIATLWTAAKEGLRVAGENATNFISVSGAAILSADIGRPGQLSMFQMLPFPEGTPANTPSPIFTRLSAGGSKVYIRGENKYLATIDIGEVTNITAKTLENGIQLTPWSSSYDKANNQIFTTFILGMEKANP